MKWEMILKNHGMVAFKFNKNIGLKTLITLNENREVFIFTLENRIMGSHSLICSLQRRLMKQRPLTCKVLN